MGRSNIITTRSGKRVRNPIPGPSLVEPSRNHKASTVKKPAPAALKKKPVISSVGKLKPALKKPSESAITGDVSLILSSAQVLESLRKNGTLTLQVKFTDKDFKPCTTLTAHALRTHEKTLAPAIKFLDFSDSGSTTLKSDEGSCPESNNKRRDPVLAEKDALPLGYSYLRHTRSLDRKLRRRS